MLKVNLWLGRGEGEGALLTSGSALGDKSHSSMSILQSESVGLDRDDRDMAKSRERHALG